MSGIDLSYIEQLKIIAHQLQYKISSIYQSAHAKSYYNIEEI